MTTVDMYLASLTYVLAFFLPLKILEKSRLSWKNWLLFLLGGCVLSIFFITVQSVVVVQVIILDQSIFSLLNFFSLFISYFVLRKKSSPQILIHGLFVFILNTLSIWLAGLLIVDGYQVSFLSYQLLCLLLVIPQCMAAKLIDFLRRKFPLGRGKFFFYFLLVLLCMYHYATLLINYFATLPSVLAKEKASQQGVDFIRFFLLILGGLFLLAFILVREYVQRNEKRNRDLREIELEQYISSMEMLQTDIRKVHHDYKNMLSGIGGYLYETPPNIGGLKQYFEQNVATLTDSELKVVSLSKLSYLSSIELKGLILSKIFEAQRRKIDFKLELTEAVPKLKMSSQDLCRICGILLDNALEASEACPAPEVSLAFIVKRNAVYMITENTTQEENIPILLGKSSKGERRGLGLSIAADLLKAYPSVQMQTKQAGYRFYQNIIFTLEESE